MAETIVVNAREEMVTVDAQEETVTVELQSAAIIGSGSSGDCSCVEPVSDEEVLAALAENDLLFAVGVDGGVLTDENNNIFEW